MEPSSLPLPLSVTDNVIRDAEGVLVAAYDHSGHGLQTDIPRAEYIVHACNLYPRLVEMLRKLEWSAQDGLEDANGEMHTWKECPVCRAAEHIQHASNCELASLLKELE